MIDEKYVRDRISLLRTKKGISEYKMSYDLGHSKNYMQNISSGRAMPSWPEFLYICEYLGVTPKEFFDTELSDPTLTHELAELAKKMSREDLEALISVAKRLTENKE